jgi:hypothetical protein
LGAELFRPSAGERLNLRDSTFTTAQLQKVTTILIDSANASRARVTPQDLKQGNDSIYKTAIRAVRKLSGTSKEFQTYSPEIKPSLLTTLLNYIGTSGYYNPFTSEAQMNYQMPVFNRPLWPAMKCRTRWGTAPRMKRILWVLWPQPASRDRLLRYSAYNLAVNEFMHTVRYTDTVLFKQLKTQISPAGTGRF